jgi:diacylglycerol O-acyltransferase / wax synthase
MGLMPITDSMFLVAERREQPMHVGGLQLFTTPADAGPDYLTQLYHRALAIEEVAPMFRRRAQRSVTSGGQWMWTDDPDVDLEHHFRHSALPRPGRIRELLALTSRLHGTLLDRERPLWEVHLIEGLEDGRFAIYTKMHHAMMDGVSALKLLQRSLSDGPDEVDAPLPWDARRELGRRSSNGRRKGGGLMSLPGALLRTATDVAGIGPAMLKVAAQGLREQAMAMPGQAPRTIFNRSITGSRRFAADAWPLDAIKGVASAAGATVNDVVLAMCSGALREYLRELDALPHDPLIAMTPVSLRQDDDDDSAGNAVGVILCNLATDIEDPVDRLMAVRASMNQGKAALKGLSQVQISALSALVMGPLGLNSLIALHKFTPPPFNLVISNIPGPKHPLYWNGARLDGLYPLSIPTDGQALNITVTSYNGQVQFGLTGCRRTAPSLQRLLTHLDDSLDAMVAELV